MAVSVKTIDIHLAVAVNCNVTRSSVHASSLSIGHDNLSQVRDLREEHVNRRSVLIRHQREVSHKTRVGGATVHLKRHESPCVDLSNRRGGHRGRRHEIGILQRSEFHRDRTPGRIDRDLEIRSPRPVDLDPVNPNEQFKASRPVHGQMPIDLVAGEIEGPEIPAGRKTQAITAGIASANGTPVAARAFSLLFGSWCLGGATI
jgi:hypothetical protein